MRILFVSHTRLKRELGASKIVVDLSEEMERIGWHCELISMMDIVPNGARYEDDDYPLALRRYIQTHSTSFDVVDYDHGCLPWPRSELPGRTLFVARAVLLGLHQTGTFKIPPDTTWKARAHSLLFALRNRRKRQAVFRREEQTVLSADLVNVANAQDASFLVSRGVSADKIVNIPYGLNRHQRTMFSSLAPATPTRPVIAFVGTFDARKGAADFPGIVSSIVKGVPDATFKLLGTYKSAETVLGRFPRRLRAKITVVPSYPADALPELLAPCSVGIFPSYLESFGFGILEMLAAGIPAFAYDVPGPPVMLPRQYLVPVGDAETMSKKVVALLRNTPELIVARSWARTRAQDFSWETIAKQTSDIYRERWERLQTLPSTSSSSFG